MPGVPGGGDRFDGLLGKHDFAYACDRRSCVQVSSQFSSASFFLNQLTLSNELHVTSVLSQFIGVGTGLGRDHGAMAPHFSAKIILIIFPFFFKHNYYTENDSPRRGKHKYA